MQKEDIHILNIQRFLAGELSETDEAAFKAWLKDNREHRLLFDEIKTVWTLSGEYGTEAFSFREAHLKFSERHLSTQRRSAKSSKMRFLRIAAAVALLAIVAGISYTHLTRPAWETIVAQNDNTTEFQFIDGSQVILGNGATLEYPEEFGLKKRNVKLLGEGFFSITQDTNRPFVVETPNAVVTVFGTEFLIVQNEEWVKMEVFVKSGKVRLQPQHSKVYLDLGKGEAAVYDKSTKILDHLEDSDFNNLYQYTKELSFNNAPLREVISVLEKHFGVTFEVSNMDILSCHFTAALVFRNPELEEILNAMQVAFDLTLDREDNQIRILGGRCN